MLIDRSCVKGLQLNICLMSREYPPETGWGGIGTYTYNLAHALTKLGHEVHVISLASLEPRDYMDGKVFIHRIRYKNPFRRIPKMWRSIDRIGYSVYAYKKVLELIRKYGVELVESPEWFAEGLITSTRDLLPLTVKCHTPLFFTRTLHKLPKTPDVNLACWLEQKLIEKANAVTSCSYALARIVSSKCKIRKIAVIHNGINLKRIENIKNGDFRSRWGIKESDSIVLYIGRLEERKGYRILAKSIPRVLKANRNVTFVFVGKGLKSNLFREIPTKFHEKVIFTGFVNENEKIAAIRACDIFVIPSIWENFPYVCLEAMVFKKPIIASSSGGLIEILDNGKSGILVPPGHPRTLALEIEKLIWDNERRGSLGKEARERLESNFTDEIMARKSLKIYKECLMEARMS